MRARLAVTACALSLVWYAPAFAASGQVYRDAEASNERPSYMDTSAYYINRNTPVVQQPDSGTDVRFFVEYQVDIFSSTKTKYSISDDYFMVYADTTSTKMNLDGALIAGLAFSELDAQVGFRAQRYELEDTETITLGALLRLPLTKGQIQPYVEGDIMYVMADGPTTDSDISAVGFGAEGGIKYNISDSLYIRGGISYGTVKYTQDIGYGIDLTMKQTSIGFNSAIGYKF